MKVRRARQLVLVFVALAMLASLLAGCDALGSSPSGATAAAAASPTTPAPASKGGTGAVAQAPQQATPQAPAATSSQAAPNLSTAVREVTQKVRPAVVQITNEQEVQIGRLSQPFTVPAGVGSGVIYDNQGHILTNNHVIEGATSLRVTLPDTRTFPARVVGADPQTDLAVIQVTAENLPVAALGNSGQLQVGDWVVAIGNALGLPGGPTVTTGVVSALGRTVQEPGGAGGPGPFLFDVIQTDAPINPGNSGGPLVNLAGEVVGINTLVAGQAESGLPAQGIGFAIAINTAKPIADELVATGKVVHPYLGIRYQWIGPAEAAQLGLQQRQGVLIAQVVSGSPAARAGVRARDVVTHIDGRQLTTESSLAAIIDSHKPGDRVTLTVIRGGQTQSIEVTLGEMPSQVQ